MHDDEAKRVYEERLRLIDEDEECAMEAARLNAALKRNDARRQFIKDRERALKAMEKKSRVVNLAEATQKQLGVPIQNNISVYTNATGSTTYNQHGNGGQYVSEKMYITPNSDQQTIPS